MITIKRHGPRRDERLLRGAAEELQRKVQQRNQFVMSGLGWERENIVGGLKGMGASARGIPANDKVAAGTIRSN